jgi:hypothetical protein
VYIPRQLAAQIPAREPGPAVLEPALSEADLARFFAADLPQDTRVPGPSPLPSGPDPRTFKPGQQAS